MLDKPNHSMELCEAYGAMSIKNMQVSWMNMNIYVHVPKPCCSSFSSFQGVRRGVRRIYIYIYIGFEGWCAPGGAPELFALIEFDMIIQ